MRETTHILTSAHLGNDRTIWVRANAETGPFRHLVIFLDGEFYRDHVGAIATIDRLSHSGAVASTLFVFVSMESMASRAVECPCHPPFAQFIVDELMPWLAALHPGIEACAQRVLVGLSYTGLAATYVALQSPGVFTRVIAQSGSFWWHDCWLVTEFSRLKTPLPTGFYLDVGSRETDVNVDHGHVQQTVSQIEGVVRLRDTLLETGHEVVFVEFEGGHDMTCWKQTLPGALRWALAKPLG